jgi:hypothetical protein
MFKIYNLEEKKMVAEKFVNLDLVKSHGKLTLYFKI